MSAPLRRLVPAACLAAAVGLSGASAEGRIEPLPGDLEGVGVDEKLDTRVPLDLAFTDDLGRAVRLGDLVRPGRPVLLTLVYYECPMLCTLVLDGLVDALRGLDWAPGREFDIVTVSIDPSETTPLGRAKKQSYLRAYGRPEAAAGWHFLTGTQASIDALTDAVGFRYRYLADSGEFSHPAVLFLLTPDGRVSRYLYGVKHEPRTLRLSLVEAADGRIGTAVDKILLYCYRYDSEEGRYAPVALRIMRLGGLVTVVLLGLVLLTFWRREARQKRLAS